jgi:hypothetical protein
MLLLLFGRTFSSRSNVFFKCGNTKFRQKLTFDRCWTDPGHLCCHGHDSWDMSAGKAGKADRAGEAEPASDQHNTSTITRCSRKLFFVGNTKRHTQSKRGGPDKWGFSTGGFYHCQGWYDQWHIGFWMLIDQSHIYREREKYLFWAEPES